MQEAIVAVIPAYNEAATIRAIVERTLHHLDSVIVVDDGSTDGTAANIADLPITVLSNRVNMGKDESLWQGIDAALARGAHAVVTLDADGQHDPDDIPALLDAWRTQPNRVIIGARLHAREKIPRARYNANRFANFWISWAAGYAISDSQSGFRIYPARGLREARAACSSGTRFVFESEILIELGRRGVRSVAVPVRVSYDPRARPSHFRPVIDIAAIVVMVAGKLLKRGLYLNGLWGSLRHG